VTWKVKVKMGDGSEPERISDTLERASEILAQFRAKGYIAWVVDASGRPVDEKTLSPPRQGNRAGSDCRASATESCTPSELLPESCDLNCSSAIAGDGSGFGARRTFRITPAKMCARADHGN